MLNQHIERSLEKEWLDLEDNNYTAAEYDSCMRILFRINRFLNVYNDTVQLLKQVSTRARVMDVGCGDGLFLLHLSRVFPKMQFEGIEISKEAFDLAVKRLDEWEQKNDAGNVEFSHVERVVLEPNSVDVILSTLVCHHLSDDEIVQFLKSSVAAAREVVIINDLHRHHLAQILFKYIQPIFFRNRIVKHDGLISIRRSFKTADWQRLLFLAGIKNYQLQWRFPFRWRIVIWKQSL